MSDWKMLYSERSVQMAEFQLNGMPRPPHGL